jgi:hypothetical protein
MILHHLLHVVPAQTDGTGFGMAVVYEFHTDRWRVYDAAEVRDLVNKLHETSRISGYDLFGNDLPLIFGCSRDDFATHGMYRVLSSRCNSICETICTALTKNREDYWSVRQVWSLDKIGAATLRVRRAGNDNDPVVRLQQGRWSEAMSFALDDAGLVRQLILFIERYGYIVHPDSNRCLEMRRYMIRSPDMESDPAHLRPGEGGV